MMTYYEYVKDVFVEHHCCMGMDVEESVELFEESDFNQTCKWLSKIGYSLERDYYLQNLT